MQRQSTLQVGEWSSRCGFYSTATISNKYQKRKVEKGILEGRFTVQKIIQCTSDQQLFYRSILLQRQLTSIEPVDQSWLNPATKIETVTEEINGQERRYLLIFSDYVARSELTSYTNTFLTYSGQRISANEKAARISGIILQAVMALLGSSNYQVYTYQSFLFNQEQPKLTVNKASFVGMSLLLQNQIIDKESFEEVLGVLESNTLDKPPEERFNLQLKLRGLGLLILSSIVEKKVILFYGNEMWDKVRKQPSFELYQLFTRRLKERYKNLLSVSQITARIKQIDAILNIRIEEFLHRVFVQEQQLTWSQVLELIVQNRPRRKQLSQQKQTLGILNIASYLYRCGSKTQRSIKLLKELGINQSKLYLMLLLHNQDTPMSLLMTENNIDDYLSSLRDFNPENMAIYKRLIAIIAMVMAKPSADVLELRQQLRHDLSIDERLRELQDYSSNLDEDGKLQNAQILEFMLKITNNFAIYHTSYQTKKVQAMTQQARSIKIFANCFK